MKKIKKNIKKTFLIALVSLEIILIGTQPTNASLGSLSGGIFGSKGSSTPNANGMLEQMEERYHLNRESMEDFGESFNVGSQKKPAPEVDIFFNPTNPKFGEKVTATAIPKYFQEGVENMFFTWYIKHEGCDEAKSVNASNKKCDVNDDGKIDTNDWKIEAMRLVASNGFIKDKADYSTDTDNDSYSAHRGGRVNIQKIDYCYIHDFISGEDYEIATADERDNDDKDGFDCEGGKVICSSPYTLSCGVLEGTTVVPSQDLGSATASGGDGSTTTEGDSSSSGGDATVELAIPAHEESFSGTDVLSIDAVTDSGYAPTCDPESKTATCPEGTTARCIKDEDFAALVDPTCGSVASGELGSPSFGESSVTVDAGGTHPTEVSCFDDGRAMARFASPGAALCGGTGSTCNVSLALPEGTQTWTFTNPGDPTSCEASNPGCGGRYSSGEFLWKSKSESTGNLVILFPKEFSEGCDLSDPGTKNPSCETTLYKPDDVDLVCEHQFPKIAGMAVGDGNFGAAEEEFWGTDPSDPSTANNGNNDEANVAGLGMDKLTWTFVPGDKVGVIVEGQSYLPTKHDDSSVAISFALVNNIFHKEGDVSASGNPLCQIIKKEKYVKNIKGFDVEIPFATVDISDCLKYNLVGPTDGHQADNMEVTLDYYPKNPNVGSMGTDANGNSKGGDLLTVTSNTSDPNVDINQIYYKWSIYGFKGDREDLSLDKNDWTLLSNDEIFRKTNNIKLLEGLGMDQFEMQLNTASVNNVEYDFLRFFVESEEFFDTGKGTTGTTRSGRGDILVEPNQSDEGGIGIQVGETSICEDNGTCAVLENQVIKASVGGTSSGSGVSNYLWTLDGKAINTLGENETKQGDSVTFLLEGRPGDTHVLTVLANDTAGPSEAADDGNKNKGEKLTLSKNFVVAKPLVGIGPNNKINRGSEDLNECLDLNGNVDESAVLGTYSEVIDPNDPEAEAEAIVDCKENVFNGSGSVTITPTYYPEWIRNGLKNVKYAVNGAVINDDNSTDCNNISCTIDLSQYSVGSTVNISFEAEYWQTDEQRYNLKSWGISEGQSSGQKIADSITVKVGEANNQTVTKKASKIIAGLAYNIPRQMIFMFRLVLTATIIVFASGILMSFGQKKRE